MYKTIAILLTLLLFFGILSCNLDGAGIFLTISESTEIADSNLATEPVRDILYKDGDDMYILHGTSVKKADISDANPNPIWNQYTFKDILTDKLTPISEAVFVPGAINKLVYSSVHYDDDLHIDDGLKSVYVGSFTTPGSSTVVTGLENVNMIDILLDGTTVYAILFNQTTDKIEIHSINTSASTSALAGSFSSLVPPTSVHFINNNGTKYFIIVFYDETEGFVNKYVSFSNFYIVTELTDPVFQVSDNAEKASPIIGTYSYGGTIYLVTNEGILITSTTIDNLGSFTAVNGTDSSDFMSIVLNSSGSTASIFSIPMTVVTKLNTTTELLIMGGLSDIYYYDIATPTTTDIPIEFTSTDTFYSNLSSAQIMDFYNVPGDGDFSLYTATSNKWIWETVDEDTASTQLL